MKATGIVRRIDDLGRVVIPKEIRRTMRIREGDPLEIYTDNDGEVIFKKYSPIGELGPIASQYADAIGKSSTLTVLICDRDHCVAASGISRKEVYERRLSAQVEELMEMRTNYIAKSTDMKKVMALEGFDRAASVVYPIISSGDVTGAVILLQTESGGLGEPSDLKIAQVAATFLGKQMEE